jgi:hypothetical protein
MISPGACLAAGDGVRVSFENSTVCRAFIFSGFVPVLFLLFVRVLLESLILAQDERWRRA